MFGPRPDGQIDRRQVNDGYLRAARDVGESLSVSSPGAAKKIAEEIGKTGRMIRKHATEIFHKFSVNSRAGLMAVWLGQKSQPPETTPLTATAPLSK